MNASMTKSDCSTFTTWSKLKKRNSENQLRRLPSGNNNQSSDETYLGENPIKSQSMPNLYKQKLMSLLASSYIKAHNMSNSSVSVSELFLAQTIFIYFFFVRVKPVL